MRWGAKVTDTAKISPNGRRLFLEKVEGIVNRLHGVRRRAMQHASLQTTAAFAAQIPLPCTSPTEHHELRDTLTGIGPSKEQKSPPRDSDELAWSTDESQALACDTWYCDQPGAQEEAFTIQGTWLELANPVPDGPDPFGCLASTYTDEESAQTPKEYSDTTSDYVFFGSEGFQCEDEAPESAHSQDSDRSVCADRGAAVENSVDSKLRKDHVLLAPWEQTFPGRLEQYLDRCDGERFESSCDPPHHALEIHPGLDSSSMVPGDPCRPISSAHLLRLQKDIEDVYKHRRSFTQSMHDVKKSLRCHRSRWDVERSEGDLTFVMKSRGYGSPLAESIAADEAWPEDEWGLASAQPRRSRLRGGTETSVSDKGNTGGVAAKKKGSRATRRIRW